jgi:hypothetical protein
MGGASGILDRLIGTALGRPASGRGEPSPAGPPASPPPGLAAADRARDEAQGNEAPGDEATGDETTGLDPGIVGVLAEKVLLAWLRNRHQLLFPFALDLRRLDRDRAGLAVDAMVAAAHADGSVDPKERARLAGALRLVGPSGIEGADLDAPPKPLNAILAGVRDVQAGALVYAASLMAVDQRKPVNRLYLRYLAARLQLSDELVASLEQRYRSSS